MYRRGRFVSAFLFRQRLQREQQSRGPVVSLLELFSRVSRSKRRTAICMSTLLFRVGFPLFRSGCPSSALIQKNIPCKTVKIKHVSDLLCLPRFHGAMSIYVDRFLNVLGAKLPSELPLENLPTVADELRESILSALDQRKEWSEVPRLVQRYLGLGHPEAKLIDTLIFAAVRDGLGREGSSKRLQPRQKNGRRPAPSANCSTQQSAGTWPLIARHDAVQASRWLSPCACRKGKKFTRDKGRCANLRIFGVIVSQGGNLPRQLRRATGADRLQRGRNHGACQR